MRFSLATNLENTINKISLLEGDKGKEDDLLKLIEEHPA